MSYQRSPAVPDQKLFMLEVVSGRAGLLQIIVNFTNYFPKSYKKTYLFGNNLTNLLSPNQIAIQLTNLLIKANFQTPNAIVSIK